MLKKSSPLSNRFFQQFLLLRSVPADDQIGSATTLMIIGFCHTMQEMNGYVYVIELAKLILNFA
jgi:hypothetical protein